MGFGPTERPWTLPPQFILTMPLGSAAASLVASLRAEARRDDLLRRLIASGRIGPGTLALSLALEALATARGVPAHALSPSVLTLTAPLQLRRRGVELRLVAGAREPTPDGPLLRAPVQAHRWATAMRQGETAVAIARREGRSDAFVRSRAELAFLSPRLQAALVAGTQPLDLTLERLIRTPLPLDRTEQERVLGFASRGAVGRMRPCLSVGWCASRQPARSARHSRRAAVRVCL